MIILSLHRNKKGTGGVSTISSENKRWFMIFVTALVVSLLRKGVNDDVHAFIINSQQAPQKSQIALNVARFQLLQPTPFHHKKSSFRLAIQDSDNTDGDDDSDTPAFNPYADPNYPDLEFVNYDDPEYSIDRSLSAAEAGIDDEVLLEQMREERRVANDEYQYNTYWHTVWNAGLSTYRGEWTVYYSSTFFPQFDDEEEGEDAPEEGSVSNGLPRLIQLSDAPLTVVSRAMIQNVTTTTTTTSDPTVWSANSYITHIEELEEGMGDVALATAGGADETEQLVVSQTYWPEQLLQSDFRGHQGIMICGKYVYMQSTL